MTAVEWLIEQCPRIETIAASSVLDQALQMEKQQIKDAYVNGEDNIDNDGCSISKNGAETYFAETYGSKVSVFLEGYEQINQDNPVTRGSTTLVNVTSSQTEISDKSWEGCDGCTEQDEVMYKNGYVKGYNAAISELPKEISDEEIEKFADEELGTIRTDFDFGVIQGMKWYREQLNSRK